jgi:hypothetical protein
MESQLTEIFHCRRFSFGICTSNLYPRDCKSFPLKAVSVMLSFRLRQVSLYCFLITMVHIIRAYEHEYRRFEDVTFPVHGISSNKTQAYTPRSKMSGNNGPVDSSLVRYRVVSNCKDMPLQRQTNPDFVLGPLTPWRWRQEYPPKH